MENKTFMVEMTLNPFTFDSMMSEDKMKQYFKEKMAHELALEIIKSDRATFTYTKDTNNGKYNLKAKVKL